MQDSLKNSQRFHVKQKLGQGTFSIIYEAFDRNQNRNVAIKVEKKDKQKTILLFEYHVLQSLAGLPHVCHFYDFVPNSDQNFIVMDLLGMNLAKAKRHLEQSYNLRVAILILCEMLVSVQEVHDKGYIHRDVKASNFVLSIDHTQLYIVDFGLAKKHLSANGRPVAKRKKADFRGTVSFASLNAHNNVDLARRDDIWSLYFTMLDFLNEKLEWREQRDYTINQVKDIKTKCLRAPKRRLWVGPTRNITEMHTIFQHIEKLSYEDRPDYPFIKKQLLNIYNNYDIVAEKTPTPPYATRWKTVQRSEPVYKTYEQLDLSMSQSRAQVFDEYFNRVKSEGQPTPAQTPQQPAPILGQNRRQEPPVVQRNQRVPYATPVTKPNEQMQQIPGQHPAMNQSKTTITLQKPPQPQNYVSENQGGLFQAFRAPQAMAKDENAIADPRTRLSPLHQPLIGGWPEPNENQKYLHEAAQKNEVNQMQQPLLSTDMFLAPAQRNPPSNQMLMNDQAFQNQNWPTAGQQPAQQNFMQQQNFLPQYAQHVEMQKLPAPLPMQQAHQRANPNFAPVQQHQQNQPIWQPSSPPDTRNVAQQQNQGGQHMFLNQPGNAQARFNPIMQRNPSGQGAKTDFLNDLLNGLATTNTQGLQDPQEMAENLARLQGQQAQHTQIQSYLLPPLNSTQGMGVGDYFQPYNPLGLSDMQAVVNTAHGAVQAQQMKNNNNEIHPNQFYMPPAAQISSQAFYQTQAPPPQSVQEPDPQQFQAAHYVQQKDQQQFKQPNSNQQIQATNANAPHAPMFLGAGNPESGNLPSAEINSQQHGVMSKNDEMLSGKNTAPRKREQKARTKQQVAAMNAEGGIAANVDQQSAKGKGIEKQDINQVSDSATRKRRKQQEKVVVNVAPLPHQEQKKEQVPQQQQQPPHQPQVQQTNGTNGGSVTNQNIIFAPQIILVSGLNNNNANTQNANNATGPPAAMDNKQAVMVQPDEQKQKPQLVVVTKGGKKQAAAAAPQVVLKTSASAKSTGNKKGKMAAAQQQTNININIGGAYSPTKSYPKTPNSEESPPQNTYVYDPHRFDGPIVSPIWRIQKNARK